MEEHEITAAVAAYKERGDTRARQRLIEAYLPLVRRVARRFAGSGERLEDLVQVGSIGLITAVDRCDPARSSLLTAYVTRCVDGEIRRHLRDRCTPLRIPRRMQTLDADAHGSGGPRTAAARTRETLPLESAEADGLSGREEPADIGVARALVAAAAGSLDARERRVLLLRYFLDLSQAEVGEAVGVSQVHVSRLLQGAIAKMRVSLVGGPI